MGLKIPLFDLVCIGCDAIWIGSTVRGIGAATSAAISDIGNELAELEGELCCKGEKTGGIGELTLMVWDATLLGTVDKTFWTAEKGMLEGCEKQVWKRKF